MKFFVYLAGKMAVSKEEELVFVDWRKEVRDIFDSMLIQYSQIDEVAILDPNIAEHDSMPTEKFFGRNAHQINLADAVLIDAREKTGIGTSQEFLIAKYYQKPVVAVAPMNSYFNKFIETSNNTVLHYIHPFLTATSDVIVESFHDSVVVLLEHFSGRKKIRPKTIDIIEQGRQDYERNFKHLDKYMLEVSGKI
jgi:hypothetical protein